MTTVRPKQRRWLWYTLGVLTVISVINSALHPKSGSADRPADPSFTASREVAAPSTAVAETPPAAAPESTPAAAAPTVTPEAAALSRAVLSYGRTPKTHKNIDYSNENGRQVYDFATTSLGNTMLVYYAPDEWWLEVKQPTFSINDLVPADQRSGENGNDIARDATVDAGPLKGMNVNWTDSGSQVNVRTKPFMQKHMQ